MDVLVFDLVLGFVSVVLHSAEHFFEKKTTQVGP